MARSSFSSGVIGLSPLGVILPTRMSPATHVGADIDDAGFVEVLQRFLRNVRNVARDFLRPELGVAGHRLEFLDVDRGEDVVLDDALGEQDRILEVVAVPRHERDEHVAAEREIAEIGRGTVGDDVALLHPVANLHQRLLVDAGRLVGALELHQPVDVDRRLGRRRSRRSRESRYGWRRSDRSCRRAAPRSPRRNCARRSPPCRCRPAARRSAPAAPPGAACSSPSARGWRRRSRGTESAPPRPRRAASATRPCNRRGRPAGTPRRPPGGRRSDRRRDGRWRRSACPPARQNTSAPPSRTGRTTSSVTLPSRILRYGDFDEAVFVDPSERRQRVDQPDVRAFRRLDRADAAVMRRMHVAHLEARALARQAARPERRQAALVRDLATTDWSGP